MSELLPCPFCGELPKVSHDPDINCDWMEHRCDMVAADLYEHSFDKWNRRTPTAREPVKVPNGPLRELLIDCRRLIVGRAARGNDEAERTLNKIDDMLEAALATVQPAEPGAGHLAALVKVFIEAYGGDPRDGWHDDAVRAGIVAVLKHRNAEGC